MKPKLYLSIKYVALVLAAASGLFVACAQHESEKYVSLFNGEDLTGWEGDPALWTARDGVLVGQTTAENPIPANSFIIWQGGEPGDFELRLEFRITAQNEKGFANSGIQYRSRRVGDSGYVVGGYQADIDLAGRYIGMLYEERGRGLLMKPGQRIRIAPKAADSEKKAEVEVLGVASSHEEILAAYGKGEWNEFTVVAEGNRLRHYLNGVLTADVTDEDPDAGARKGLLAFQLHRGEPMTVEFRDIRLKELP